MAQKLVEHLHGLMHNVTQLRIPDRTTSIGKLINELLSSNPTQPIDNHAMHLLFSANRWELNKLIRQTIHQGTTIIVDRYSYSGLAYSCANSDLTMKWCSSIENGLPKPDLVIYLDVPRAVQTKRPGFGDERFETSEFQDMVREQYEILMRTAREQWLRIDVSNKTPEDIVAEVMQPVQECIQNSMHIPLGDLDFS